jgi:membrane protease subunit HflK
MQQIYSNATKVYVDQKAGSNLLFLPLDKLLQMSGGQGAGDTAPATAESQPSAAPPTVDPRSRDAFRSRDREVRP